MNSDQRSGYVKILEEPAAKALRFRYECEGRSAGSLPGANSTHDKKTFPKIQVISGGGGGIMRGVVVVSCVTLDPPYRPHPHNLVGKEGCKKGVCTMEISTEDMSCEFSNLGIQCVKKKDIEDSLKVREEIRVDPFRTGFHHKSQPGSIDLNSVRLCFQVFLEGPERGQFKIPLKPVVSEPIYDKKAINDLTIMKLSDCTSPVVGNKDIILLCDKVSKDDVEIRFYLEDSETGQLVWEAFGDFQPSDVHKQYAICFRTPPFRDIEITTAVRVQIQLRCPSKDTTSVSRPFDYLSLSSESGEGMLACLKRKRLKEFNTGRMGNYMEDNNSILLQQQPPPSSSSSDSHLLPAFIKRPRSSFPPPPVSTSVPSPPSNVLSSSSAVLLLGGGGGGGSTSGGHQQQYYNNNIKQEPPAEEFYASQQQQYYNNYPPGSSVGVGSDQQLFSQFRQPNTPTTTTTTTGPYYEPPPPAVQAQQGISSSNHQQMMMMDSSSSIINSMGNISLPNLSDVNLSLLESHLSENFNDNLNISNSQF